MSEIKTIVKKCNAGNETLLNLNIFIDTYVKSTSNIVDNLQYRQLDLTKKIHGLPRLTTTYYANRQCPLRKQCDQGARWAIKATSLTWMSFTT